MKIIILDEDQWLYVCFLFMYEITLKYYSCFHYCSIVDKQPALKSQSNIVIIKLCSCFYV